MAAMPLPRKAGGAVAYQPRKRAKTSNILPITDANGYVVASADIIAGNHNDAFDLKLHLQAAFTFMKRLGLPFQGTLFNADGAFDTKAARKVCFNHGVVPNMAENKRNRRPPSVAAGVYSTPMCTSTASPVSVPSPGLISFAVCSSVLIGLRNSNKLPTRE
jgi:hypothetical protein